MARMPGADWQGEHGTTLMSWWDILCVHTIVGFAPAPAAHWSNRADGWLYQSRDTRYRSAANLNGNHRVLAVENEDHGPAFGNWSGSNVPRFTDAQAATLVQLILWCHATHNIPIELVPDSKPGRRGIAYHRQGCDGNFGGYAYGGRVPGGELWSSAFGKVCPGDRRIAQLINEIIPRARQLAGLDTPEDDLTPEQDNMLTSVYWAIFGKWDPIARKHVLTNPTQGDQSLINRLVELQQNTRALVARPVTPTPDVDEVALAAALAPLLPDVMSHLSDEDVSRVARAAADEEDRRDWERLAG